MVLKLLDRPYEIVGIYISPVSPTARRGGVSRPPQACSHLLTFLTDKSFSEHALQHTPRMPPQLLRNNKPRHFAAKPEVLRTRQQRGTDTHCRKRCSRGVKAPPASQPPQTRLRSSHHQLGKFKFRAINVAHSCGGDLSFDQSASLGEAISVAHSCGGDPSAEVACSTPRPHFFHICPSKQNLGWKRAQRIVRGSPYGGCRAPSQSRLCSRCRAVPSLGAHPYKEHPPVQQDVTHVSLC